MKEQQYTNFEKEFKQKGPVKLGISASYMFRHDPKYMAFKLARYKFVAKMIERFENVLEVGAGEGFASHIVAQHVKRLICSDWDETFIENGRKLYEASNIEFMVFNPLEDSLHEKFDAIYFMDVLEHIHPKNEDIFIKNLLKLLKENGVMIIGIPSKESQIYAKEHNKIGHVNCKGGDELKGFLKKYFHNVFLFSSNDEVIHTGFYNMAHYLIGVCCGKKI